MSEAVPPFCVPLGAPSEAAATPGIYMREVTAVLYLSPNEDEWTGNFSRFPHLQFYGCFGGAEGMLLELREEIQKARVEHRRKLIEHERRIAAGEVDADVSDSEL